MGWVFLLISIVIIIYLVKRPDNNSKSLNNYKENNVEDSIIIMEETIKKAKRDLETGIKREELDELLKKGYITQDVYNETVQNIEKLEMIANWDISEIKKNLNNNKEN